MSDGPRATSSSYGIGFTGLLAVLFIYLKLTAQIDWSWLWVLSPLWIGTVFGIFFVVILAALLGRR